MFLLKGENNMLKRKSLALFLVVLLVLCTAGCGSARKKGKTKISFWAGISDANQSQYTEAIKKFNDAHSNIEVTLIPQSSDFSSNLSGALRGSNPPDVVMVEDKYFKQYVGEGYLTKLDNYIESNTDESFSLDEMWKSTTDRFSYDPESGYSGQGKNYYAVPSGNKPSIIYYNASLFKEQKVNIISVGEDELENYNQENGSKFLPHGFYVYDTAPASGLTARSDGKYYVFNNLIPMNWEELIELSKIFTKSYNSTSSSRYGFLNEWWFSFGWSVGGDCLEWDSEKNQYIFALGDDNPGYLVTGDGEITVNGTKYSAGDLLSYADKIYVAKNKSDSTISGYLSSQRLYELPSTRDAFTEFCRLSQSTSKPVTGNVMGYGISPSPTTLGNNSKLTYFTTGEVAMVCDGMSLWTVGQNMKTLGKEWDVAPLYYYREYNADGTVKKVNGTEIAGKKSAHNASGGYAIPENSKNKDAAWEFIRFMAGTEGQSIMMTSDTIVPNQKKLAYSEEYLNSQNDYAPKNMRALVDVSAIATVGDWSYVEDGEWINPWSNILNTKVRDGDMTLDEFFNNETVKNTDTILKKYTSKKFNS